jgi:hypothetical protein
MLPRFSIQDVNKLLTSLDEGIQEAQKNGGKITKKAEASLKVFTDAVSQPEFFRPSFAKAVRDTIAEQDGRYYPWALGTTDALIRRRETSKNVFDRAHQLAERAPQIDREVTRLKGILDAHMANKNLSETEIDILKTVLSALQSSATVIDTALTERAKLTNNKWETKDAWEIVDTLKTKVNMRYNDIQGGPFGLWIKFDKREAEAFAQEFKRLNLPYEKGTEVLQQIFDEAKSEWGNLVLGKGAVEPFKALSETIGLQLDWDSAINQSKNDHPIVALYAVAIREEMEKGDQADIRKLNVMLRAGRAAVEELGVDFIRTGPTTLGGAAMPALSATFAGADAHAMRVAHVEDLNGQLGKLEQFLARRS